MSDRLHTICNCEKCNGIGKDDTGSEQRDCTKCKGKGVRDCIE